MLGGRTTSSAWAGAAASNASAAAAQMAAMRAARAIGASVTTPARRPPQPVATRYGFSVKLSGPVTVTWQKWMPASSHELAPSPPSSDDEVAAPSCGPAHAVVL